MADPTQLNVDNRMVSVRIYKEYHSVCPLVGIGTPLSPARVPLALPQDRGVGGGWEHTRLRVRGWGESQFEDWGKKLSTLPSLWIKHKKFQLLILFTVSA